MVAELGEEEAGGNGLGEGGGAEGELGEKGAFAAGGVADEEDRYGGSVGVHVLMMGPF